MTRLMINERTSPQAAPRYSNSGIRYENIAMVANIVSILVINVTVAFPKAIVICDTV